MPRTRSPVEHLTPRSAEVADPRGLSARVDAEDGSQRDLAGVERDDAAEQRDQVAADRDRAAASRDRAGRDRDVMADSRDRAASERDRAADDRDRLPPTSRSGDLPGDDAGPRLRSDSARTAAAADRREALLDRRAGAAERGAAGRDRSTALTDRGSGAAERGQAGDDRDTALSDRGASAVDREHASLDGLTGTYVRGAGLLELEREVVRAQRTGQPLALAFVDVDHLKAVNDAGGHAAGDRLLAHVADTLRARLRRYDLVVRYGGDEFVCALPGVRAADAEQRFALVNADLAGQGSVTVGIAEHHQDATLAELIAGADRALYAHRAAQRQGQPAPQILPTLP